MAYLMDELALLREGLTGGFGGFLRYAVPVLSAILLLRCAWPLLTFRREPEIWAWLNLPGGKQIPITHWENVIGRSKSSDVHIDFPTVSRNHAVLTRYDDGSWTITDADSKEGTMVSGRKVKICAIMKRSCRYLEAQRDRSPALSPQARGFPPLRAVKASNHP